ncbi:MAG TPA: DNA-3-methyladenine glycosylase [Kofleriaceae bacterium]|nr:DNA-3-methyladenine glycosylase [Kofleriaceae bacterium]
MPAKSAKSEIAELAKRRLPPAWFQRDVVIVAKELVGCALVHRNRAGLIVETEAYMGPDDLASHARFGPTARTSVMFGPGGVSYVYLCYGIHQMFNIVTGTEGQGQAVLIRAVAPLVGLPDDPSVGRGPGKVTTALKLDRRHDRKDLASHSRFGPTARTSVMFGPGGVSYVYLCYGIHQMFNIVTGAAGDGQAVLIRAVAPLVGLPDDPSIGRGPGKVTKALALDRSHDRKDLADGTLYVARYLAPPRVAKGPRVGVAYAGPWAERPYRFWWRDHPAVSRVR